MDDRWKPVPELENFYEISESGIIRRLKAQRGTSTGKIIKQHINEKGYLRVRLTDGIKGRALKVHRLVAKAFIDNPLNLPQVNHKDLNKANNHYSNLEWCTGLINIQHANELGIHGRGWLGKTGKAHNRSIPIIATLIETGEEREFQGTYEAARQLNLLQGSIANVIRGRVKTTGGWKFRKK